MTLSIFRDPESGESFMEPIEGATIDHRLRFVEWMVKSIWRGTEQADKISELENQMYDLKRRIEELEGNDHE